MLESVHVSVSLLILEIWLRRVVLSSKKFGQCRKNETPFQHPSHK